MSKYHINLATVLALLGSAFLFVPEQVYAFTTSDFSENSITAVFPNQLTSRTIIGTEIGSLSATTTSLQTTFYVQFVYKSSRPNLVEIGLQGSGSGCVFRNEEGNQYSTSTTEFQTYVFHTLPDANCFVAPSANYQTNFILLWGAGATAGDTKTAQAGQTGTNIGYIFSSNVANINLDLSSLIATSSSPFELDQLDSFCGANLASSTSFFDTVGSSISGGICRAFAFLFVPNSASLGQFSNMQGVLQSKIPFSYFYNMADLYDNLVATSAPSFISIEFDISSTSVKNTPIGTIIPPVVALSTSTISTYLTPSLLALFRTLMTAVIWLGFALFAYRRVLGLLHKNT